MTVACEGQISLELRTLEAMIGLYCRPRHEAPEGGFCRECASVWAYARQRVQRCIFLPGKPTCAACTVHCYKPEMRARIRQIMRHAGPRMPWRHPFLTVRHYAREYAG